MRQIFHMCIASHEEVMFRSDEDLVRGFNCFAVACLKTESTALSDGFLPSHCHFGAQSECPEQIIRKMRYSYTRFFNEKYRRKGHIGETVPFIMPMEGIRHITAGLSYINRQALHHGICETPFEYRHCSANAFFRSRLGKWELPESIPARNRSRFLPDRVRLPDKYRMTESGLLLREDIIDTNYVEEIFITPRNFLYYMNRLSDEKWQREQIEETAGGAPVTLEMVESVVKDIPVAEMLSSERGRVNRNLHTDITLCSLIDNKIVPEYFGGLDERTVYDVPLRARQQIGNSLLSRNGRWRPGTLHIASVNQLRRCLVI